MRRLLTRVRLVSHQMQYGSVAAQNRPSIVKVFFTLGASSVARLSLARRVRLVLHQMHYGCVSAQEERLYVIEACPHGMRPGLHTSVPALGHKRRRSAHAFTQEGMACVTHPA